MTPVVASEVRHAERGCRKELTALTTGVEVRELAGAERLEQATLLYLSNGARETRRSGLFCFIGARPATSWLRGVVAMDADGFILTDRQLPPTARSDAFSPLPFETSAVGVFAAGDVRHGALKRVAAAVGEGSSAVTSVHERRASTA